MTAPTGNFPQRGRRALLIVGIALGSACLVGLGLVDADEKQWELSSYRIKLHLEVNLSVRPGEDLQQNLAAFLEQRIYATLYPLWSVEIAPRSGRSRNRFPSDDGPESPITKGEAIAGFDKVMSLVVTATAGGYLLECQELDHTLQLRGPLLRRTVRQRWTLPEHCFELLRATFSPVAMVRRIPEQEHLVHLLFKGSGLPRRSDEAIVSQAGDVYQPWMVRIGRQGEVNPDKIRELPWTYLTLLEMEESIGRCRVDSGVRRPFGLRRRGRIEHLAIALRQPPATSQVRFYARHDASHALTGYEVFRRNPDEENSQFLGLTDAEGKIEITPGPARVTSLFLRSGGQLLAKVPVVPGAPPEVEVPIADDNARLNAQAALTSLREQLIDLVARRNILMARIRDRLDSDQLDEAQELLSQLDALPGRAQFAQRISAVERDARNQSQEPRIQARIEQMFSDTRKLLGRFLSTRRISELQRELNSARQSKAS